MEGMVKAGVVHEVEERLLQAKAVVAVVGAFGVAVLEVIVGEGGSAGGFADYTVFSWGHAYGLWAVMANWCQKADCRTPAANSWRTISSESMVSWAVCVGKPYIR